MLRSVAHTLHVFALGVWLGGLLLTGVAAAILFPTMKALEPKLPAFAAYKGDHWMIAAGRAADRVFTINDMVQLTCAMLAVLSLALGAAWGLRPTGVRGGLRIVALTVALAALGYQLFGLAPRMSTNLRAYWTAAQAGDHATAETKKAAFNADHPTAQTVMSVTTAAVAGALLLGAWPGGMGWAGGTGRRRGQEQPAEEIKPRLEEPALLRDGGRR